MSNRIIRPAWAEGIIQAIRRRDSFSTLRIILSAVSSPFAGGGFWCDRLWLRTSVVAMRAQHASLRPG